MRGRILKSALAMSIVVLLGTAAAAEAVVLYTPPLRAENSVLHCNAFNASNRSITVKARLYEEATGTLKATGTLTFAPGRGSSLAYTADTVFGAVCRFSYTGTANEIRGSASIMDFGGSTTRVIVEAR
jgi:hypothetical protein